MKTTRTIEISVEREEVLLIRKSANRVAAWCAECRDRSPMITMEEAMVLTAESSSTIHKRKESGQIHFAEGREGLLLVCLNSISCVTQSAATTIPTDGSLIDNSRPSGRDDETRAPSNTFSESTLIS